MYLCLSCHLNIYSVFLFFFSIRQQEEDKDLESIMLQKGFMLSPLGHTEKLKTKDYSSESDTQFVWLHVLLLKLCAQFHNPSLQSL